MCCSNPEDNPPLRIIRKKAVQAAGGDTHRLGLYDMVLIKDNHLRLFKDNAGSALKAARKETSFSHRIEIEVKKIEDAVIAAEYGADIVMLDNMSIQEVKRAVAALEKKDYAAASCWKLQGV